MKTKQILSVLLLSAVICSLCSCISTDGEKKPILPISDTSDAASDTQDVKKTTVNETIEKTVCLNEKGVTVTAVEFDANDFWGKGIKLSIENNSNNDYQIGVEELAVNHSEISDLFSCTVAAGKKANETLHLMSSELERAEIDAVGQVDVVFKLIDPDNYNTVYTGDQVTIKTSAFDESLLEPRDEGTVLYDKNDVRIIGKYVKENSLWGTSVVLYVENNRKEKIAVSCDDLSVDGVMASSFFYASVHGGMHTYDSISLLPDDQNGQDFSSIGSIELKFNIYRADNFKTIEKTKAITFKVSQ